MRLSFLSAGQRAAWRCGATFWPGLRNGPADSTTASWPRQALGDGHALVVDRADLDGAPLDLVLAVDDVDVIALLVAQHRALRKQRRGRRAGDDLAPRRSRPGGSPDRRGRRSALRPGGSAGRSPANLPDLAGEAAVEPDRGDRRRHADADEGQVLLRHLRRAFPSRRRRRGGTGAPAPALTTWPTSTLRARIRPLVGARMSSRPIWARVAPSWPGRRGPGRWRRRARPACGRGRPWRRSRGRPAPGCARIRSGPARHRRARPGPARPAARLSCAWTERSMLRQHLALADPAAGIDQHRARPARLRRRRRPAGRAARRARRWR